jgi:hypothetical protein
MLSARSLRTFLAAGTLALIVSGGASAATLVPELGGDGNDPFPDPLNGSPSLAKCDTGTDGESPVTCTDWEDGASEGDYSKAFSLEYLDEDEEAGYSFSWTFDPSLVTGTLEVLFPKYIAVKQARAFQVWLLDPSEYLGGSIFTGLNDISHVSFYDTGKMPPVPLPAAGWLMLAGLGGLAALRQRRRAA